MRVIAGTLRGRRLIGPKDDKVTRPITDRVKTSVFDRLWSLRVLGDIAVLDLFCGTGSLGIEALSRGATWCTFVDLDRQARVVLQKNLETFGLADRSEVMSVNALTQGWTADLTPARYGLVFCDPPYRVADDAESAATLAGVMERVATAVQPGGVAVLRTDAQTGTLPWPGWSDPTSHQYGSMTVHFYERD